MRISVSDCQIDDDSFCMYRTDHKIPVEPRVLDLILYLLRNRERVVSKRELIASVWGGVVVGASALARCVCLARHALNAPGSIRTAHTRGYQWMAPITTAMTARNDVGRSFGAGGT